MFTSYSVFKKIFNPIIEINFVFLVWMLIGRLGYLGQYIPSYDSSTFILTNIIVLDIFIFIGSTFKTKFKIIKIKCNIDKIFRIFRIFSLIISIPILLNLLIQVVFNGISLTDIRDISYSIRNDSNEYTRIYFNKVVYYIYQYLIRGFAFFDITYNLVRLIKDNKKISIISILNFIMFIIIMQSRIEFLKFIIFSLVMILNMNIKLNEKQKKILKRGFIIMIIAVIAIFNLRSSKNERGVLQGSVDSFIIDFSGSNYMFSIYYDSFEQGFKLNDSNIILKYFGGLGLVGEMILKMIGFYSIESNVTEYLVVGHNIGSMNHYNCFYTIFFEFMNSGGKIGAYIFDIFFGIIIGKLYYNMKRKNTTTSIYISSFMTYVMIMGTYNYILSTISTLMIIFCYLLWVVNTSEECNEKAINE